MVCKQALRGALAEGREKASSTVMLLCSEKQKWLPRKKNKVQIEVQYTLI